MIDDLRWLGFDWDEGYGCGDSDAEYVQSNRMDIYERALHKLKSAGLVYPCTCSRRDIEAGLSAPHSDECLYYGGTCRGQFNDFESARSTMPQNRIPAWRFRVTEGEVVDFTDGFHGAYTQVPSEVSGDFVLARHPQGAGYMLAVVVDDDAMGINQVVRGDDLLSATPRHILIYRALGLNPPEYFHLPLVVGPDGRRLAKRHGDTRVARYREAGMKPQRIIGALAASCGWARHDEELSLAAVLTRFDFASIPHAPFIWRDDILKRTDVHSPPY